VREAVLIDDADVQSPLMTHLGTAGPPTAAGETARVTTRWLIQQTPPYYRLRPIVQLSDANGTVLASNDRFLLGTDRWQPGEILFQQVPLDVPIGTPPGDYSLSVLWVDRDTDTYVSYIGAEGAHAGIVAPVGSLTVTRPETFPPASALTMDVRDPVDVAPGVRLLGWDRPQMDVRPGESLGTTLYWQAMDGNGPRMDSSLEAVLANDTQVVTIDSGDMNYPPPAWTTGELVALPVQWRIPSDLESGTYTLRLRAGDADIALASVRVEGLPRVFDPPAFDEPVNVALGDSLTLAGYTLEETPDGGTAITLVWHALTPVDVTYTVFIHRLDADGQILDQRDAMPRGGSYPTSLWTAGEYVVDRYVFPPVDGAQALRIGLYEQTTGSRLPVSGDSEAIIINDDSIDILTKHR
jgi:hypothetical protein